jgi:polyphosphate kinase 2 (PPK2 family)
MISAAATTEREKSQMDMQRYVPHFPAAGEIVIFDRSWYYRAGVERVMEFCTDDQTTSFLQMVPLVERAMVDSGMVLLKYWLEVSPEEQTRRLVARIENGRKIWKLSPMDLKPYRRWYDYSRSRDDMFTATDPDFAPCYVARWKGIWDRCGMGFRDRHVPRSGGGSNPPVGRPLRLDRSPNSPGAAQGRARTLWYCW